MRRKIPVIRLKNTVNDKPVTDNYDPVAISPTDKPTERIQLLVGLLVELAGDDNRDEVGW